MVGTERSWWIGAGALTLSLLAAACEIPPPPPAIRYECEVQVSPVADPELVIELNNLTDERFLDDEGNFIWDYYQCLPEDETCPDCSYESDEITIPNGGEMDAHWARLVATRIAQLAEADPNSEFAQFDLWCEVQNSRKCVAAQREDGDGAVFLAEYPECSLMEVQDEGLAPCEGPPTPGSCLEIDCGDGPGCTELDFGALPIGQEATRTVTLGNCGGGGDPVVAISLLRLVPALETTAGAFTISEADRSCLPEPPADETYLTNPVDDPNSATCSFDVTFRPEEPQPQSADLRFRGSLPQHEIRLTGAGASGTPVVTPDRVCIVDQPGGQCFGQTTVSVFNSGPGDLLVSELRIVELNPDPPNFQLVPPAGPSLPVVLPADGSTLDLEIQWCDGEPRDEEARLEIVNSNPMEPTLLVQLSLRPECTPGG